MARIYYTVVGERLGRDKTHLYERVGILVYGRLTCISMLWLVLVSSRGTNGRTKDDRGKD